MGQELKTQGTGKLRRPSRRRLSRRPADRLTPSSRARNPAIFGQLAVSTFLLLAVLAVFGPTTSHDFINFDDDVYISANRHIQQSLTAGQIAWAATTFYACNWHPLTWFSHILDYRLFGLQPGGHHLTSVLLHAAAAVFLFLALRRMTGALWPSAWVAAVFAIHPLRIESVAWVAERKDVLSGLFGMLTLWFYARYAERPASWGRYLLVVASFALGLMAKPMLVTLPFVLLLLDFWPLGRFGAGRAGGQSRAEDPTSRAPHVMRLILEKLPLFVLSIASCAITLAAQSRVINGFQRLDFAWRVANAVVAYVAYLGKLSCPINLAVFYPLPQALPPAWEVISAVALLLAVTVAAFSARQKYPYVLFGWLWYVGTLVPVIGLVQVGSQAMADRYTYLTQIGLCAAIAWGAMDACRSWSHRRGALAVMSVLVLAVLMATAWRQTGYWRDSKTLWARTLACTSPNPIACNGMGNALSDCGQVGDAIDQYRLAIETDSNYAPAHHNLGRAFMGRGQVEAAIDQYLQALARKSDYAEAHSNLGEALASRGQVEGAINHYEQALVFNPDLAEAHNNLGNALANRGQVEEALIHYRQALQIKPDLAQAHNNLGAALAGCGQFDEAIEHYHQALALKPSYAEALTNLGNALASRGQVDEAIKHYQQALRIKPDYAEAHFHFGYALAGRGQVDEAIAHYRQALATRPEYAEAQYNLGYLLARRGQLDEAFGLYRMAVASKPDFAEARSNLGTALAGAGQFDKAIVQYQQALKIKPDFAEAHTNLGLALVARGRVDEAIEHYQQALKIKPDYAEAHFRLGYALAGSGQIDEAIAEYRKAVAIRPDYTEVHNNLGNVLVSREEYDEAIVHYRRALASEPDDVKAHYNLANALAARGRATEALAEYQKALKLASAQKQIALAEIIRARIQEQQSASPKNP
jgi:protein O-mannosyl-transferase